MLHQVTIVVPLAPGERAWTDLCADLKGLEAGTEILFAGPEPPCGVLRDGALDGRKLRLSWLRTPQGRACQMNLAARAATRPFLWFLHADSRLTPAAFTALERALRQRPEALHYFDLAFDAQDTKALPWMRLNSVGVRLRSRCLRLPFGDQGFCLARERFMALGGFDETAPYGEDHLLVWQAHRAAMPVRCTGATIVTSARKYREQGWLRTTGRHLTLTYAQVLQESLKTWRAKREHRHGG